MMIKSINILNFGKLSKINQNFNEKLNNFCFSNGYGKTTTINFIVAMFYGLTNKDKRALYAPWNGNIYGGSIEFTYNNTLYRIEREFDPKSNKKDSLKIYNLNTNKEEEWDDIPGVVIFGINETSFMHSVYVPQSYLDYSFDDDLSAKLAAIIGNVDDSEDIKKAIKILEDAAKQYKQERVNSSGKYSELKNLIDSTKEEINENQNIITSYGEIETLLENKLEMQKEKKEEFDKLSEASEKAHKNVLYKTLNEYKKECEEIETKIKTLPNISQEKYDEVSSLENKAKELKAKCEIIKGNSSEQLFVDNPLNDHKINEIEQIINNNSKYYLPILIISLIVLGTFTLISLLMKNYLFFIGTGVGFIGLIASFFFRKSKKDKEIEGKMLNDFFIRYKAEGNSNEAKLQSIKQKYQNYINSSTGSSKELQNKLSEIQTKLDTIYKEYNIDSTDRFNDLTAKYYAIKSLLEQLAAAKERLNNYKISNKLEDNYEISDIESDDVSSKYSELNNTITSLEKEISILKERIINRDELIERNIDLNNRVIEYANTLKVFEHKCTMLTKAKDILNESMEEIKTNYVKPAQDKLNYYLKLFELTDDVRVSTDLKLTVDENGSFKNLMSYSEGTKQIFNFAARLAIIDSILQDSTIPLILDDPFVNYDDKNIKSVIDFLKKEESRQIFYFTCHTSRNIK